MSDLKNKLLKQIDENKVKIHSKNFFIVMRTLLEIGIVGAVLFIIFIINLSFYLPKRGMGLGQNRIEHILSIIPWSYLALGIVGLALVVWFIYRFTGAYKKGWLLIAAIVSMIIVLAGFVLSVSNFNEKVEKGRGFRHFYNTQDGAGSGFRGRNK